MIEQNRKEFERCNITAYHAAGITGQGITVVVLDDGGKSDTVPYCEHPLGFIPPGKNVGHAVSVSKVIHEVAPKALIVCLPYINKATEEQKKSAVKWIIDHTDEVDIINCSFHEWENDIFKQLEKLNKPIVCASGNQDYEDKIAFPARYSWTVAVGALEEYRDRVAGYSNEGPELDCICYTNIYVPVSDGVMEFNGTSCAAPMVSGMLALLMSKTGIKFTGQEAKELIKQNCIDYYEKGHDWKSGYGLFVLPEMEVSTMTDIKLLHPDLRPKAAKLIELAKAKGINIVISQTLRTKEEQDALYAQGRTKPGNIVTRAEYPLSLHCWGAAFDIAVIVDGKANWDQKYYDIVGPLGESLGLEWGGRWTSFKDRPHFQLPGYKVTELIKKYSTPEKFMESWGDKAVKSLVGKTIQGEWTVKVDGKEIGKAIVVDGATYAPVRKISEALGKKVGADNKNKIVYIE